MKHINIYNTLKNMKKDLKNINEHLHPYDYIDLLKDTDFDKLPIQLFVNVIGELQSAIKAFENQTEESMVISDMQKISEEKKDESMVRKACYDIKNQDQLRNDFEEMAIEMCCSGNDVRQDKADEAGKMNIKEDRSNNLKMGFEISGNETDGYGEVERKNQRSFTGRNSMTENVTENSGESAHSKDTGLSGEKLTYENNKNNNSYGNDLTLYENVNHDAVENRTDKSKTILHSESEDNIDVTGESVKIDITAKNKNTLKSSDKTFEHPVSTNNLQNKTDPDNKNDYLKSSAKPNNKILNELENKGKEQLIQEHKVCDSIANSCENPEHLEIINQNIQEATADKRLQNEIYNNSDSKISEKRNDAIEYIKISKALLKTIKDILLHKIYLLMLKEIHILLDSDIQSIFKQLSCQELLKLKVRYLQLRKKSLERKMRCLRSNFFLCQAIKEEKNLYEKIFGCDNLFECFVGSFLKVYFLNMDIDCKYEDGCEICYSIKLFVEKYVDKKGDIVYEI